MAVGSATRVMNAGLACPDWPLCYGELIPAAQMNLQVFLEWFHRLDAAAIGLSAIALLGLSWLYRYRLPGWMPIASALAVFLIVFQGVLGGLTVTELLRFDIVTAHLGTALLFFSVLLAIGFMLSPYEATGNTGKLAWISSIAALLVYLQSLLGALVGSRWALHQCLSSKELCLVMNSHIAGIVPATAATLAVAIMAWRQPALSGNLRKLANFASLCLIAQLVLGLATFRLHLQVEPLTVAHQAVGAALLGTLVGFSVLAWRDRALSA
ncbi:MAG: heme A synthase [Microcoleus sp. SU_5_6]|nr:heme A synthase [Microcoleus sp. SU_5_6]